MGYDLFSLDPIIKIGLFIIFLLTVLAFVGFLTTRVKSKRIYHHSKHEAKDFIK